MKTVSIRFSDMDKKTLLYLGYVGENLHRRILIDCKKEFEEMPGAIPALVVTAPNGLKYPVDVTVEGNTVIWDITNSDLIHHGNGEIQLTLTKDEEVGKSAKCRTKVDESIEPDGEAPDPIENWLVRAENLLREIPEEIAQAIEEAKESGMFDGVGISSIGYVRTVDNVNIYRITLTDRSFYDFEVSNGDDGQPGTNGVGIVSITKTGTVGLVDTYTITLSNGQTYPFTVTNGQNGAEIDDTTPALNKVFSSSKVDGELTQLKSALTTIEENCVEYILQRKIIVGENQITSESTASGTGWSGSVDNGFTHSSGNTNPLTFEVSTTEGNKYIVEFDWTNYGEGRIGVGIGDSPTADPYNGTNHAFVGFVADGGYLKIYPISSYTGTIENVKIRPVEESGDELIQQCKNVSHGSNENEISGWFNVAIGPEAMRYNQNGTRNMAVGYGAMQKLISGNRNVAIGTYSMPFVSKGESNIAIGSDTIYNWQMSSGESVANNNIAIGKATMRNGNLIEDNIAIGKGAMSENALNAKENIAIGTQAGYNASQYNTLIGVRAGYYFNGDGGESNTCIGHEAGFSPYHNGKNNVFIGKGSRPLVSGASASTPKTVNNSIAIGKDAKATKSYQLVIGNTNITEVVIAGKILTFNQDGTVTWEALT